MKSVDLIEATEQELGGKPPTAGSQIVLHGVRYLIVDAKPPKVFSSRWRKKPPPGRAQKWKLLVERIDQSKP